jgi:hypothetical protein
MMPVSKYAEVVVGKVVQKHPPKKIWAGNNSGLIWWVEALGLRWVLPFILRRLYGLSKLNDSQK